MTTAAQGDHMYQEPNPMDPLDSVKRWLRQLWPAERVAVMLCAAAGAALLIWLMLLWVSR
jgi:hypothetical protein